MLTKPRLLMHAEGAFIFALTLWFYRAGHYPWWLFAALFLAPDFFMLGYLKNAQVGAAAYNLVHTLAAPMLLLLVALLLPSPASIPCVLIWLCHIGFDRMLGYGLKYPTFFKDTHLQRV
jgi:Domain of unknown function (DUF4260)